MLMLAYTVLALGIVALLVGVSLLWLVLRAGVAIAAIDEERGE